MESNSHRQLCRWQVLAFPWILLLSFLFIFREEKILFSSVSNQPRNEDTIFASPSKFEVAKYESLGFFDDIDSSTWQLHKNRARLGPIYSDPEEPYNGTPNGAMWLLSNVDPFFTCPNLRRVGGLGDGPKWTCDPHRLASKPDCLIYSIGSQGVYIFEDGLQDGLKDSSIKNGEENSLPNCEIHVFDPNPTYERKGDAQKNIHYHSWGLKSSYEALDRGVFPESYEFLTFAEIRQRLGHENRRIDIFKIDCEGCEFSTFHDWLNPLADIRQILVETHYVGNQITNFFERFFDMGFVLFSKEANTTPGAEPAGQLYEWGFIRFHPNFLNRETSLLPRTT